MRKALPLCLPLILLSFAQPRQAALGQAEGTVIEIQVSPSTILLSSKAKGPQKVRVTVHADIDYSDVATYSVTLSGIGAAFTFPDARGDLVAKFEFDAVADLVREMMQAGEAILRLDGYYVSGGSFSGEDTVRVKT